MPMSIAPTNLLPLGDQPTRISVRLSRDLLKFLDPSMEPLAEGDSVSRMKRKGKAAIDQMASDVSTDLFHVGAEVARRQIFFAWPKPGKPLGPTWYMEANHYLGICFDHHVTAENHSPRLLELTADEEVDGTVIFHAVELGAEQRDFINDQLNELEA